MGFYMLNKVFFALSMGLLFSVNLVATATLPTPTLTPVHHLNRIIAVVNEEIITQSEFDRALVISKQQIQHSGVQMPDEKTFRKEVLDQLIYQKLQLQIAKRNNITATDAEVDTAIGRIITQNHITLAILKQKLQEEGTSFESFKDSLRQQITISKVQRQAVGGSISVSKAEIAEFRKQHAAQLNPASQYDIATIIIPLPESPTDAQIAQAKATATLVYNTVRTQNNFNALMEKYPGSSDLGFRALSDLPQLFAAQVVKMHPGEVAGPIQAPNGFHVIKLIDVQQKAGNLTTQQIQMIIYQQKFEKLLRPWLEKLKKSAYVKIYIEL